MEFFSPNRFKEKAAGSSPLQDPTVHIIVSGPPLCSQHREKVLTDSAPYYAFYPPLFPRYSLTNNKSHTMKTFKHAVEKMALQFVARNPRKPLDFIRRPELKTTRNRYRTEQHAR